MNDGEWHDIVLSWNGSTGGQVRLYDNGTLVHSGTQNAGSISTGGTLMLGQEQDSVGGGLDSTQVLHGDVAGLTIWNRIVGATEVTIGPDRSNALHDFSFSAGSGTSVQDNNSSMQASIVGTAVWDDDDIQTKTMGYDLSHHLSLNNGTSSSGLVRINNLDMPTSVFTIGLAFRTVATSLQGVFSYAVPGDDNEVLLTHDSSGLNIWIGGTNVATGIKMNDGEWHDIVLSWNGSTGGQVRLYDNGTLVHSGTQNAGSISTGGTLMLGQEQDSVGGGLDSTQVLHGDVAGLTIWNRIVGATEVTIGPDRSNALHDFSFSAGSGTSVQDNNSSMQASIVGTAVWDDDNRSGILNYDYDGIGIDTITDSSGYDTVLFGDFINHNKIWFDVNLSSPNDLIVMLDDKKILTIKDQISESVVDRFEFDDGTIILASEVNNNFYGTSAADTLNGTNSKDTIYAGASNDSVYGAAGNDILYGEGGNDTLYGEDGNDLLVGGDGNDTINGGNGNDLLYGGAGTDTMSGGAGADSFIFEAASAYSNIDTVSDFNASQGDSLKLSNLLSLYDPLTEAITDFVELTTSGSNSLVKVDRDGTDSTYGWTQISTLTGVTGLTDEATLVTSGNLIVA